MVRRLIIGLLAMLSLAGGLSAVNVQPAGAAIYASNSEWFLAATRACLRLDEWHDTGWRNHRMWCYDDTDTQMVGVQDIWFPNWVTMSLSPGNGVNLPAKQTFWGGAGGYNDVRPHCNTGCVAYGVNYSSMGPVETALGTTWYSQYYMYYWNQGAEYNNSSMDLFIW